jgi:hypothetical protein
VSGGTYHTRQCDGDTQQCCMWRVFHHGVSLRRAQKGKRQLQSHRSTERNRASSHSRPRTKPTVSSAACLPPRSSSMRLVPYHACCVLLESSAAGGGGCCCCCWLRPDLHRSQQKGKGREGKGKEQEGTGRRTEQHCGVQPCASSLFPPIWTAPAPLIRLLPVGLSSSQAPLDFSGLGRSPTAGWLSRGAHSPATFSLHERACIPCCGWCDDAGGGQSLWLLSGELALAAAHGGWTALTATSKAEHGDGHQRADELCAGKLRANTGGQLVSS